MVLHVKHLAKTFESGGQKTEVLRDVNFSLGAGETLALEGESGSGKSTILHMLAGLEAPTAGEVEIAGVDITKMSDAARAALRRTVIGVIFQQFNLIPSLTVSENIAFHARLGGKFDAEWAGHLTREIGIEDQAQKYPEALSGGQQQRVAIARTLAAKPRLILADEPTGNLDETTADTVLALMLESAKDAGAAVLMVTHSQRQAARMQQRLVLSHGIVRSVEGAGE